MRDVAALAGVSLKTVSRVFNGDPHVRPELRERVQAALAQSNYVPNDLAQTFRRGRGSVVGVAVPTLLDPFFAAIVSAVDAEMKTRGYATMVSATGFDPAAERDIVTSLLRRHLAGLVLAPVSADQSYLASAPASVPTVFVDQPPAGLPVDAFVHDDLRGAAEATRHLLGHGNTRVGFLGRAPHLPTSRARLAGYRQALGEDGPASLVVDDVESPEDAAAGFRALCDRGADAIVIADPRTTIACVPELKRSRVAVVGFGDFPLAALLDPPVTVVDQDPAVMGAAAARHLLSRLDAPPVAEPGTVVLPVRLVERRSCFGGR
ncbi:LacI family DNA-binding transcriptional regulator [Catenuloplanes atrovinosus]|nr:LacI family DNA-binding transcriptional regulator [Catenuloplanes atrovinosus]